MMTRHLSDTELQDIASNGTITFEFERHLIECTNCKTKLANYKFLFEVIHQTDKPVFDFDVAELVLEKLPIHKNRKSSLAYNAVCLSSILSLFALVFFKTYILNIFESLSATSIGILALPTVCIIGFQCFGMLKMYRKQKNILKSFDLLQL
jgi:hypothetical protein